MTRRTHHALTAGVGLLAVVSLAGCNSHKKANADTPPVLTTTAATPADTSTPSATPVASSPTPTLAAAPSPTTSATKASVAPKPTATKSTPTPTPTQKATPTPTPTPTKTAAQGGTLIIQNFAYSSLSVAAGAPVTVINKDSATHTVTLTGIDDQAPGSSTTHFNAPAKAGTYSLTCDYHSFMHGSLTVT